MNHDPVISSQMLLAAFIVFGPLVLGALAWLLKPLRSALILGGALATAGSGLALVIGGNMVLSTPHSMLIIAEILEWALILAFFVLSIRVRSGIVMLCAVVQAGFGIAPLLLGLHAAEGEVAFVLDKLSSILVLIISLIGSAIVVYALGYMKRHEEHAPATAATNGRFFFVLLGFLGLMNGLVLADNIKWLTVFWECTTLCSFFLIGHDGTPVARQNARRALLINALGGVALSAAQFIALRQGAGETLAALNTGACILPVALLIITAFTKSAQLPFQSWLLGAMVAPTPVSALLHSSTMVKAGSYLVLRLAPAFDGTVLAFMVALAGGFTFTAASALAVGQSNAKKVLAYSTIANLGLIVACAGIATPLAYSAALIILIYHAVSKALLFLCIGSVEQTIGSREIEDMSGLLYRMPITTIVAFLGMISMVMPPFGMLIGKWMAIESAAHMLPVLLLLIIGSALTIFFWVRWVGRIITASYHEDYHIEKLPITMLAIPILLVVIAVLSSGAAMPIFHLWIKPAALSAFTSIVVPANAERLMNTTAGFLEWPLLAIIGVALVAALASLSGFKKAHVRLPYLAGENAPCEERSYDFLGPMDKPVIAHVSGYYISSVFQEANLTLFANPVAILILLSLFARIGIL